MTDDTTLYRCTITYSRTRPYYPPQYQFGPISNDTGVHRLVVGPYRTRGAVKAGIKRAKESYPLANLYGDNEKGYKVHKELFEVGELTVVWEEDDE